MRRPRSRLTVSTFPFLAVLLCAMGALILLLLVFDRRAKEAARARSEARAQAEHDAARADHEKRLALARDRDETLHKEARDKSLMRRERIEKDLAKTREKAEAARKATRMAGLILAEASAAAVADRAEAEKARDAMGKLEARREVVAEERRKAGERKSRVDEERARQERDLARLEAVLARVKAERDRDKKTYSIVPYRGKQGENRQPLYIECAARGLVFLPDRLEVDPVAQPRRALDEIDRRAEEHIRVRQAMGVPVTPRPYFMLLVRPDGIGAYYRFQVLTRPYDIDFGYELVDADWVLDIPPEPGQEVAAAPSPAPRGAPGVQVARSPGVKFSGSPAGDGGFDARPGSRMPGEGPAVSGYGGSPDGGTGAPRGLGSPGSGGINFGGGRGTGAGMPGVLGSPDPSGPGSGLGGGSPGPSAPGSGPVGGSPGPSGPGSGPGGGTGGPSGPGSGLGGGSPGLSGPGFGSVGGSPGPSGPGSGPVGGSPGPSAPGSGPGGGSPGPSGPVGGSPGPSGPGSGPGGGSAGSSGPGSGPGGGSAGLSGPGSGPGGGSAGPSGPGSGPGGGSAGPSGPGSGPGGGSPGPSGPGSGPPGPITGPPSFPQPNPTTPDQRRDDDEGFPGPVAGLRPPAAAVPPRGLSGGASGGLPDPDAEDLAPLGRVLVPLPRAPERNPPSRPMRLAKLSGPSELVMFVECRVDGATVHPGGRKFTMAELSASPSPVQEELRRQMDRRQALARPGESLPKPHVRYLVWNDGVRSYHAIYPLLGSWDVTKSQQSIESKEELREALRQ